MWFAENFGVLNDKGVNLGYTQFYIQNGDNYLFRPHDNDFYNIYTIPKKDWGMILCK
jgi:hypothetical protein